MTDKEREEWYQDMREEHYQDEIEEHKLRTDYEYFLSKYSVEIEELQRIVDELKKAHEECDWEFDLEDIL